MTDNVATLTYYVIALNPDPGKVGILAITKVPGSPSTQVWTGEEYRSQKKAIAAMDRLNAELFGTKENA